MWHIYFVSNAKNHYKQAKFCTGCAIYKDMDMWRIYLVSIIQGKSWALHEHYMCYIYRDGYMVHLSCIYYAMALDTSYILGTKCRCATYKEMDTWHIHIVSSV